MPGYAKANCQSYPQSYKLVVKCNDSKFTWFLFTSFCAKKLYQLKSFLCFFNFSFISIKTIPLVVNRLSIIAYFSNRACVDIGVTTLTRMFRTIPHKNESKFFLFLSSYMMYSNDSIFVHNWKLTIRLCKAKHFSLIPGILLRGNLTTMAI